MAKRKASKATTTKPSQAQKIAVEADEETLASAGVPSSVANTSVPTNVQVGVGGTVIYGGYVVEEERDPRARGTEKFRTYSNLIANLSIVAASLHYYLNLVGKAKWKFAPADDSSQAKQLAEKTQEVMEDTDIPLPKVVKRASMFRMYGFSLHEWTSKTRKDGTIGFASIEPRPQITIERWWVERGKLVAVSQRDPNTGKELVLPRAKLLYLVDDVIDDAPTGLGVLRHVIETGTRLRRYQQLEGIGFEMNLRGVPLGRAPLSKLKQMVQDGKITEEQYKQILRPLKDLLSNHVRNPDISILLDSDLVRSEDPNQTPTGTPLWSFELLQGASTGEAELAATISRLTNEIAIVMGTEHILLGSGDVGSYALAKSKSQAFELRVDGALYETGCGIKRDLIKPLFMMNGWPEEMMPTPMAESVQSRDMTEMSNVIRNLATSGAVLSPDDEVINEFRRLAGLPDAKKMTPAMLALLAPKKAAPPPPKEK